MSCGELPACGRGEPGWYRGPRGSSRQGTGLFGGMGAVPHGAGRVGFRSMASDELQRVEKKYRRIGRRWIYSALSFAGFQGWESIIRRRAVARLQLERGDAVLDVACGQGANLPFLVGTVGEEGRVVATDISETMLAGAEQLVRKKRWPNVHLVRADAAEMDYLGEFDGAICTLGMTVIPRWQEALKAMVASVRPGRRVVIFDGRWGVGLRRIWNPYYRLLATITGGDLGRDIPGECRKLLQEVEEETLYLSNTYIASGRAPRTVR